MSGVLRTDVHVTDADNVVHVLAAGSTVPEDLEQFISNPKAFTADDAEKVKESGEPAATGYDAHTIADLQGLLRDRELPVSGSKAELVERLTADDAEKVKE